MIQRPCQLQKLFTLIRKLKKIEWRKCASLSLFKSWLHENKEKADHGASSLKKRVLLFFMPLCVVVYLGCESAYKLDYCNAIEQEHESWLVTTPTVLQSITCTCCWEIDMYFSDNVPGSVLGNLSLYTKEIDCYT